MNKITHAGWGVRAEDVVAAARKFLEKNNLGDSIKKALFLNPTKLAREYMAERNRMEKLVLERAARSEQQQ